MKIAIGICDYKTSNYTNLLLRSIFKNLKSVEYEIFILDQSPEGFEFKLDEDLKDRKDIHLFVNGKEQLFPYVTDLKVICKPDHKHSKNVQFLMDNCGYDNFLLFDCDTILKNDVDFINPDYITCAFHERTAGMIRLAPYIQYFNLKYMRDVGLKYLDEDEIRNNYDDIEQYLIKDKSPRIISGLIFTQKIFKNNYKWYHINRKFYIDHYKRSSKRSFNDFLLWKQTHLQYI